ncbi:MAG: hypothetical protein ACYDHZ_00895 [Dehalococcoidia bacterium]
MKGVCKVCGCTDEHGCIVAGDPAKLETVVTCHWILDNLCSACCVEIPPGENCFKGNCGLIMPKECQTCANLEKDEEAATVGYKDYHRCGKGRFDERIPDGAPLLVSYAWRGIQRPNKAVARAQKQCPAWEVHPRYKKQK